MFKQLLASGGMWVEMGSTRLHIDPGPGALVQAVKRKLEPAKLDAILLSHAHLDHTADINSMIEAMTNGGFHPRGEVIGPRQAFEEDPVVLHYLRGYMNGIAHWEEGGTQEIGEVKIHTPVRHQHPTETYGMIFERAGTRWAYIADTNYFPELAEHYQAPTIVINTVLLEPREEIAHLSIPEAKRLIEEIKPETAILTHFGMTVLKAHPWEIAQRLSDETGVNVIAARDGMRFEIP
ncbi:MAG: MBL fold metallo-hydrolase [Armatimonadetes bacterium]|nr:MBL fold metallo-hydrolase [Armatimonadota bacterium]